MKAKLFTILAAVILLCASNLHAIDVDFCSDAIIRPGDDYDTVSVFDTPPLQTKIYMFGGSIIGLMTHDSSTFNMHAGIWGVDGGWGYISNSSTLNIFGGSINLDSISVVDSGTLNIYGGDFLCGNSPYFSQSSSVNIYGYGFNYGFNQLTGFLSDGSSFMFNELPFGEFSHMNLIVIPEPATVLLLGLGTLFLRKRK